MHESNLVEKIINNFEPTTPNEISGHGKVIELIGPLADRAGSDRRPMLIQKICEIMWPPQAVVMLASGLVEICDAEVECISALKKISKYAVVRALWVGRYGHLWV